MRNRRNSLSHISKHQAGLNGEDVLQFILQQQQQKNWHADEVQLLNVIYNIAFNYEWILYDNYTANSQQANFSNELYHVPDRRDSLSQN